MSGSVAFAVWFHQNITATYLVDGFQLRIEDKLQTEICNQLPNKMHITPLDNSNFKVTAASVVLLRYNDCTKLIILLYYCAWALTSAFYAHQPYNVCMCWIRRFCVVSVNQWIPDDPYVVLSAARITANTSKTNKYPCRNMPLWGFKCLSKFCFEDKFVNQYLSGEYVLTVL